MNLLDEQFINELITYGGSDQLKKKAHLLKEFMDCIKAASKNWTFEQFCLYFGYAYLLNIAKLFQLNNKQYADLYRESAIIYARYRKC